MHEASETSDDSSAKALLLVADEEFRAMESGDVAAFMGLLAPDALFLPPNDSPKGGAAVRPWIAEFLDGFRVRFREHEHEELVTLGDWAVLRTAFRWEVAPRAGGDVVERLGNTVRIFRRGNDGTWRLAREIWATHPLPG